MKLTFKASAFGGAMNTQHKYAKTVATLAAWAEESLREVQHSNLRVSMVRLYAKGDSDPSLLSIYHLIGEWKLVDDAMIFERNTLSFDATLAGLRKKADAYNDAADSLNEVATLA